MKTTEQAAPMTAGEIVSRLIVCAIFYQLFTIVCVCSAICREFPNWGAFIFTGVFAASTMAFVDPAIAPHLRNRRPKPLPKLFWVFVSVNIAIVLLCTEAMLGLAEDDGNFNGHPTMDLLLNIIGFPTDLFSDSDFGATLNCLLWGLAIAYGCRFVIRKMIALKFHNGQARNASVPLTKDF